MSFTPASHPDEFTPRASYIPHTLTSNLSRVTRWYQRATVRVKTLLMIIVTFLVFWIILALVLRVVVLGSFLTLEQQTMRTNVVRTTNTLNDTLHALATLDESYAVWDDTYAFVAQPQSAYIDANWYASYFTQAQLNLVVIVDPTGHVVFSKAIDWHTGHALPIPARLQQFAVDDPLLTAPTATTTISGVVLLADHPMLVAAHAIMTSEGTGPSRGTLLLGRSLDDQEVAQLAHQTQLALTMDAVDHAPAAVRQRLTGADATAHAIVVQPLTSDTIDGYQVTPDLDGGAGLLVQVHDARDAYAHGGAAIRYAMGAFLLAGALFGVVLLVLLDRSVLARLTRLAHHLQVIGVQHDLAARVPVAGADELAHVSSAVNTMLSALEQAQQAAVQAAAAQAEVQVQADLIRVQQVTLAALATPLIPITDRVMVMPLIGAIDAQRAEGILQTLLVGVAAHRARTVILDMTGVPSMDTEIATALLRCAHAVKLLGAQVMITGIRPDVAQTLVGLGVAFTGLITRSTVQTGIAEALQRGF